MNADIVDLRDFYASGLGIAAESAVAASLMQMWRAIPDERLLGLGYTLPYLDRFAGDCERALAFMPASQGAVNWPVGGASRHMSCMRMRSRRAVSSSSALNGSSSSRISGSMANARAMATR